MSDISPSWFSGQLFSEKIKLEEYFLRKKKLKTFAALLGNFYHSLGKDSRQQSDDIFFFYFSPKIRIWTLCMKIKPNPVFRENKKRKQNIVC